MADYHSVYKGPEGESTKWDDIQRKLGNLPEKEPVWKPDAYQPEEEESKEVSREGLEGKSAEELEELEDECGDDRFMEAYRRKRLEELRKGVAWQRFGGLEEIRGSEFVAQVTNAGEGIWVVCHLYKDSVQDCAILNQCLEEVARQYPNTKFVKILSTGTFSLLLLRCKCIPGYPDENLPTVLLYKDKQCLQTMVGLRQFGGKGTSPELVAISLNRHGAVCGDVEQQEQQVRSLISRLLVQQEEAQQGEDEGSDFD
ncbi:Phosducin-like protein 3 [Chlorella vulgaris]